MKRILAAPVLLLLLLLLPASVGTWGSSWNLLAAHAAGRAATGDTPHRQSHKHKHHKHFGHKCTLHGYSAFCRIIHPGKCPKHKGHSSRADEICDIGFWVGFHVPGHLHNQVEIYARTDRQLGIEIVIQSLACPPTTPQKKGFCFRVAAFRYDSRNGRYDIPTNPSSLAAVTRAQLYSYSVRSGKYSKVHVQFVHPRNDERHYDIYRDVIYFVNA